MERIKTAFKYAAITLVFILFIAWLHQRNIEGGSARQQAYNNAIYGGDVALVEWCNRYSNKRFEDCALEIEYLRGALEVNP